MLRRIFLAISLVLFIPHLMSCSDYGLGVQKIDEQFYVILGDGGNSGVLLCDTAVLVIDSKVKSGAERLHRWVENKAGKRKVYIINTHIHKDHSAGNHLYDNPVIIAGNYGTQFWNAVNTSEDMPTLWLNDTMTLKFGDEVVSIENMGQVHTFDDVVVYLHKRKALFTGDIVLNKYHPFLDEHVGANVDNYLTAMDNLMFSMNATLVIPGHGDTGDENLIHDFKNYFLDMKEAANNPDLEEKIREKYLDYASIPINKAGFDQTLDYIRKSGSLR